MPLFVTEDEIFVQLPRQRAIASVALEIGGFALSGANSPPDA
jgi:hypothetical protein